MANGEWYTPAEYIRAARLVFNERIDLDPASCSVANEIVLARRYYTKEDNGLERSWQCSSLWLNPPYGRLHGRGGSVSWQSLFAARLLEEHRKGNVGQAILLSLGNPNSRWFQPFFNYLLCYPQRRISFIRPDGGDGHFGFPLAFCYLGPHEDCFIEIFQAFGPIVSKINRPGPALARATN